MKKLLSIILSVVMLFAVGAMSLSAFAVDDTVASIETTYPINKINLTVNGKPSKEITYERDQDDNRVITFTYVGSGKLIGWEFPGLTEGKEYEILSQEGNSITIQIINGYDGEVTANAIVEETTTPSVKPNNNKVSPKTGAAAAAGIAAMGAGAAILAATKKREND